MTEPEPQGGDRAGSGLTDSEGNPTGHVTDHASEGVDFLLSQFKSKPRIESFLKVCLAQVQAVEDALWDLYTKRTLDAATGVQLDGLGAIVGEPRAGRVDAVFRRFIRVRILVNLSNGRTEEMYSIGLLALEGSPDPVLQIWERYPKAMTINFDSGFAGRDLTAAQMMSLFRQAKDASVRLTFIWATAPPATSFTWGDSLGRPHHDSDKGWGSYGAATPGGHWASVIG